MQLPKLILASLFGFLVFAAASAFCASHLEESKGAHFPNNILNHLENKNEAQTVGEEIQITKTFEIGKLKSLDLSSTTIDFEIVPSTTGKIELSVKSKKLIKEEPLIVSQDGEKLSLQLNEDSEKHKNTWSFQISTHNRSGKETARIAIPSQIQDLALRSVSGDMDISADTRSLEIHGVSSDILLRGQAQDLEGKTVSGDITIEKRIPKIKWTTVSGDLQLKPETAPDRLSFTSVSGDLKADWSAPLNAHVKMATVSGDLEVNGKEVDMDGIGTHRFEQNYGTGNSEVSVKTTSGDFELNFK